MSSPVVFSAHALTKGNFLVMIAGIPTFVCQKVKIPDRTQLMSEFQAGGAKHKSKSQTGHEDVTDLELSVVQAYEFTDAGVTTLIETAWFTPPVPGLVVETLIIDNAGVPRKSHTCLGCKLRTVENEEMEGGSEDPIIRKMIFAVESVVETPQV